MLVHAPDAGADRGAALGQRGADGRDPALARDLQIASGHAASAVMRTVSIIRNSLPLGMTALKVSASVIVSVSASTVPSVKRDSMRRCPIVVVARRDNDGSAKASSPPPGSAWLAANRSPPRRGTFEQRSGWAAW